MTIEYSNRIKFSGWPEAWQLDENNESQLEADCDSLDDIVKFLEIKVRQRGLKKDSAKEIR